MLSKPKFENRKLKRPQFLYQAVQDEVKAYILEQSLMPGDALPPETELAEQLGVSRNSVREAIKSLETLGIVEARTGAGLFVRNFSGSLGSQGVDMKNRVRPCRSSQIR